MKSVMSRLHDSTYTMPIYAALVMPILLFGVPRQFAILNATLAAACILGLHQLIILPFSVFIHIVAMIISKKDPDFFSVFLRHLKIKNFYNV